MKKYSFILVLLVLLLIGCGTDSNQNANQNTQNDVEFTKIATDKKSIDQQPANRAKELLSKHDEVTNVKAVNSSDKLVIAIEIEHMKRFLLKQIEKDLKKEMEKEFEDYKVELSSDKKIILELEELEEKIQSGSIPKKELKKEVDRIIKFSHEQT